MSDWVPIDVFSPNAVDLHLLALGTDAEIRSIRAKVGADARQRGAAPEDIERQLDALEVRLRAFARAQAEATIESVRKRLLTEAADEERSQDVRE